MNTTTMKAVRVHGYGGPEVLRYEDVAVPTPGEGEILVRVHAAGVNPIDWKVRAGYLKDFMPFPLPFVPGTALSGTVAGLGAGVRGYAVGDAIFGTSEFGKTGSYAEYTTTRPELIGPKPGKLDHVHAAAVPVSGLAAWEAMFGEGMIDPRPGRTILIHGAAGAVGSFAAQLAKWRGATVIGVDAAANAEYLKEIGVDRFVDFTKQPFDEVVGKVDAVLDTIGGEVEARSWKVLKPGGVLASTVAQQLVPSAEAASGVRGAPVNGGLANPHLAEIAKVLDDGIVKLAVAAVLPLPEARQAQELSQAGRGRGKIVLNVTG